MTPDCMSYNLSQVSSSGPGGKNVLVTGASGFVGARLAPVLEAVGWRVRCASRDAAGMRRRWPQRTWLQSDLTQADDLDRALDGCQVAYYLVHSLGGSPTGLFKRELELAAAFALAAERAGTERIVYLGAIAPQGPPSEHLRSRLEVGRLLRSGGVPTLELRAGMIVGFGSASWRIVRDVAARLPAMVLPRWLRSRSQPVAIDDVIVALATGARLPLARSASFDLPGPEVLSYRDALLRTARLLGHRRLTVAEVPMLSPTLSSQWLRLVTRADWRVTRELVLGLTYDLIARNDDYWQLSGHPPLLTFEEAARRALGEEARKRPMTQITRRFEGLVDWMQGRPPAWAVQT
jgi:uncharacterized protein YbjT (DUF2867 family)